MNITWINDVRSHSTGAFISLRSYRAEAGNVRLSIYFSARAVASLGLKPGERLLVGLDGAGQKLAFRPTLFGGNALRNREKYGDLNCMVTLPLNNLPQPQIVRENDLIELPDAMAVPFAFDEAEFQGWKKPTTLRMAA